MDSSTVLLLSSVAIGMVLNFILFYANFNKKTYSTISLLSILIMFIVLFIGRIVDIPYIAGLLLVICMIGIASTTIHYLK